MPQYLLSVHHDYDAFEVPSDEEMQATFADVDALNTALEESGAYVFAGGLHAPDTATVVREQGGRVVTTDGPYAEAKEHIGGFWVIRAADLDAALEWAGRATVACRNPVEVRPFQDEE